MKKTIKGLILSNAYSIYNYYRIIQEAIPAMLIPSIITKNEAEPGAGWQDRPEVLPRSLPELAPHTTPPIGSNGMEFVLGRWPGDETDEEVEAILEAVE